MRPVGTEQIALTYRRFSLAEINMLHMYGHVNE